MSNRGTWIKRAAALSVVALGAVVLGAPVAEAGTSTSNFTVSTTVNAACVLTTTPNLVFPAYQSGTGTAVSGSTAFTITCGGASAGAPVPITLAFGNQTGGTATSFQMKSGANTLNYQLCQDVACATFYTWNTAGSQISVNASPYTYTLAGTIAANQAIPAGAYSQALQATLTY
jgi:spore coat protein U-like protein